MSTCGECEHYDDCMRAAFPGGCDECKARTNERKLLQAQLVVAKAMGETIAEESLEKALLQEQNTLLLQALEAAEWGGYYQGGPACSVCGGLPGHHSPDCILDKAIKTAREG